MWTYVIRRLLYAIPILFGVLLLTFAIFYTIQSPEDLSKARVLQKGGTENDVAADLRGQGYAELNEDGEKKLDIFNRAASGELDLEGLTNALQGVTWGEKSEEERVRPFKNDKEKEAYEKVHGEGAEVKEKVFVFTPVEIDVPALRSSIVKKLTDAHKKKLSAEAKKENPLDQTTKDLVKAAEAAKKELEKAEETLSGADAKAKAGDDKKPDTPEIAALREAHKAAQEKADAATKAYEERIEAIVAPKMKGYTPSDDEIFTGILESDQMKIGTVETRRFSMAENFFNYITDLFTFNFRQTNDKRQVSEVLAGGMGPSLMLMLPAFILSELLGVFFGLFAALFRGTKIDRSLVIFSVLFMSITPVAFIIFAQKFFASDWNYFPVSGFESGIGGYSYLALPILIYILITIGSHVRFNRIIMLDEVGQDYVRTAKAKGLSRNTTLFKHVLRNALVPLITRWAVAIPNLYLGSLLLESFFAIPGLGGITVQAVLNTDINQIRALVFIGTIIYILATLLSDVLYAVVDPRVKLS